MASFSAPSASRHACGNVFCICVRMCWPRVVLRTAILVRAVLKLLQFTSLWRSRLPNTGAGCDISTRPLAQASVKSVGRAQIIDHSPVWRVRFQLPRNYLNCEIKLCFTFHFAEKTLKHKLTLSILQSYIFRTV